MKSIIHINTFGRDSEAPIRFIIADYLLPWMNGHFFLEQLWQA